MERWLECGVRLVPLFRGRLEPPRGKLNGPRSIVKNPNLVNVGTEPPSDIDPSQSAGDPSIAALTERFIPTVF